MKIKGIEIRISAIICLALYYGFAQYLPNSYNRLLGGRIFNRFRIFLCKRIFKSAGNILTINRKVNFGSGRSIEIGDNSGIGANVSMPSNTKIGRNVMLSRNTFILSRNHEYNDLDKPINEQGFKPSQVTTIDDDCWIGMNTLMTPGRHVKQGTIVAMGCVLTKDFPEYSIVGGNPSKLIKSRK